MYKAYIINYKKHFYQINNEIVVYNKHEVDHIAVKLLNNGFWVKVKKND